GAEGAMENCLAISASTQQESWTAAAYGNLGLIYQARGDLDRAEEVQRKALEINEALGRQEGMANKYGNLGLIYQTRGDLDRAREYRTKARDLYARIGMPHRVTQMQDWLDGLPPE